MTELAPDYFTKPVGEVDPEIAQLLRDETRRQETTLEMIASENFVPQAVMDCQGSTLTNKYAEGLPGKRYYGGCEFVDEVEKLAIRRAKDVFGAEQRQRVAADEGRAERLAGVQQPAPEGQHLGRAHEDQRAALALAQDRHDARVLGVAADRADVEAVGQAGGRQQAPGARADHADDRDRRAEIAADELGAVAAVADRGQRGERGVPADDERAAAVQAHVPDAALAAR